MAPKKQNYQHYGQIQNWCQLVLPDVDILLIPKKIGEVVENSFLPSLQSVW
jgi:hypothetical protein